MKLFSNKYFLPSLILNCFLISCSSTDEPPINIPITDSSNDKVTVSIDFATENDFETRTMKGYAYIANGNYGEDGLIPHDEATSIGSSGSISVVIYNDGVELAKMTGIRTGANSNSESGSSGGITYYRYPDKFVIQMTFFKSQDPSKISIYAQYTSASSYVGGLNYQDLISNSCTMMAYQKLAASNNWNALNTKMTLKRRISEFIVLTNEDLAGTYNRHSQYYVTSLNCDPSPIYGVIDDFVDNQYSYDYQYYDYLNDESYAQSIQYVTPYISQYPNLGNGVKKTTFKGASYYCVGADRAYITDSGHLPIITDKLKTPLAHTESNNGKRLRYLVCGAVLKRNGTETKPYKAIEIPSTMQLKPNRKYVFVNKNGTRLFTSNSDDQNPIIPVPTRSEENEETNFEILSADDFDVYELTHDGYPIYDPTEQ